MHAIYSVLPLPLLAISSPLSLVSASAYDAVCHNYYGRPTAAACTRLLDDFVNSKRERFFGIWPVVQGPKPRDVSEEAWMYRSSLPGAILEADCSMALLSVFKLDGKYSSTVTSNFNLAFLERQGGIFGDCVVAQGIGGFRQTRTLSSHLPASK